MKPVYVLQNNKKLDAREFIYYFEHKVLYTIRKYKLLEKKEKQNLEIKNLLKKEKLGKTFISKECLDDIALKIILKFIRKKNIKKELKTLLPLEIKGKIKIIRPFCLMSKKEIELYAKLKKINITKQKNQSKRIDLLISSWLDSLEEKHPEVKNAIVKSLLKIEKFL